MRGKTLDPCIMFSDRYEFPTRLFVYLLGTVLLLAVVCEVVMRLGEGSLLKENNVVEWAQVAVLMTASMVLWLSGTHALCRCLSGAAFLAVLRELDVLLDEAFFEGAYKRPLCLGLVVLAIYALRKREALWEEIREFDARPAFMLMLIGSCVALGWAQVLGQRGVWRVFDITYVSGPKRIAEESLELVGYFLILCGAFEEWLFRRQSPQTTTTSDPDKARR